MKMRRKHDFFCPSPSKEGNLCVFFLNFGPREIVEVMQRASEKAETVSAEKKNMSFASGHKNNNNNLGCGFNILIYLFFLPQNLVEILTI